MERMRGVSPAGGRNGGRLGFWRSLRPRWTPAKSSTIHAFENIRVYIEYSHYQFRIYGVDASLRHIEELQVLAEVLLVHWTCARDKADLLYLPALTLYHLAYDDPEGCVLVLSCTVRFISGEVPIADVGHSLMFQNAKDTGLIAHGWEDHYSVRSHPPKSFFRYYFL